MVATEQFLKDKFSLFNKTFFENKLQIHYLKTSCLKARMGYCSSQSRSKFKYYTIAVTHYYDVPQHKIEEILLHEMIHLWQYQNNLIDRENNGHGYYFHKYADKIQKISNGKYNITNKFDVENLLVKSAKKNNFFIFVFKKIDDNNNIYITNTSQRNIQEYQNLFKKDKQITDLGLYKSSNQIFAAYRIGKKYIHYYKIKNEKFERELKPVLKAI